MKHDRIVETIRRISRVGYSRSGGPGGQNVNKVNSRVTLHIPITGLELSEVETERIRTRLGGRVNASNELVIDSSETRSAHRNLERAWERAASLIDRARRVERPRRPTRATRAAHERRLRSKRVRGRHKYGRSAPDIE